MVLLLIIVIQEKTQKELRKNLKDHLNMKDKGSAILEAIRKTDVDSDIIIHNNDMSIWCILR